ncbi:unnamed protein product, partial [Musa textilis]
PSYSARHPRSALCCVVCSCTKQLLGQSPSCDARQPFAACFIAASCSCSAKSEPECAARQPKPELQCSAPTFSTLLRG